MNKHPLSQLARERGNEFGNVKIFNRDVNIRENGHYVFCESVDFFEKEFFKKNNIKINNQKSFANVIQETVNSYCNIDAQKKKVFSKDTNVQTNVLPGCNYEVLETFIAKAGIIPFPIPYFSDEPTISKIRTGEFGSDKKIRVILQNSNTCHLYAPINAFGVKISSGTYYFKPVELELKIVSNGTQCKLVGPPKVNQQNYNHFFVYRDGEICYGDSSRWNNHSQAFSYKSFSTKRLGYSYAQVLNEAVRTLHLGYKNDSITPVKRPSTLANHTTPINGVTIYNNL